MVKGPPSLVDIVVALDPALVVEEGGALDPPPGVEENEELLTQLLWF
jgi:hypothetical protein